MDGQGNSGGVREYRKCNWTVHETIVLIAAKKMDEERRMKRSGEAEGRSRPAELRWKSIQAIFTSEKIQDIVPLAANAILILGQAHSRVSYLSFLFPAERNRNALFRVTGIGILPIGEYLLWDHFTIC
ncbi:hypothetical protein NE237_015468 [Protea cynaroides]|uniref:Uncharacterized protein n=1 Tax=Protea cynaroides TaxID=273540 RepID=A0A9Q0KE27_9MAGN|nr:hypothetical protein NE237_015468 [Protea cynaroides]